MKDLIYAIPRRAFAILAVAHAAFISVMSSCPGDKLPGSGFFVSWFYNLLHAPVFAALATFIALALGIRRVDPAGRSIEWSKSRILLTLALVLGYGLIDEWHQSFVSKRSSDPIDLVTDLLGSIAAVLVLKLMFTREDRPTVRRKWVMGVGACAVLALLNAAFASLPR